MEYGNIAIITIYFGWVAVQKTIQVRGSWLFSNHNSNSHDGHWIKNN